MKDFIKKHGEIIFCYGLCVILAIAAVFVYLKMIPR